MSSKVNVLQACKWENASSVYSLIEHMHGEATCGYPL